MIFLDVLIKSYKSMLKEHSAYVQNLNNIKEKVKKIEI